jgi:DNA-binding response OmpR family regulator
MKILIVEDNVSVSEPLKLYAEMHGHSAIVSEYKDEAIAILNNNTCIDGIICDIALRGSDGTYGSDSNGGIAVAKEAKALKKRIVAVTDVRSDDKHETRYGQLIKIGIKDDAIFNKPIIPRIVFCKLEELQRLL